MARRFVRGSSWAVAGAATAVAALLSTATLAATPPDGSAPSGEDLLDQLRTAGLPATSEPDDLADLVDQLGPGTTAATEPEMMAPSSFEWTRVANPALEPATRGGRYGGVTETVGGAVAIVNEVDASGIGRPRFVTSADGRAWTSIPVPLDEAGGHLAGIAHASGVTIAVGSAGGPDRSPLVVLMGADNVPQVSAAQGFPDNTEFYAVFARPGRGFVADVEVNNTAMLYESGAGINWAPITGYETLLGAHARAQIVDAAAGVSGTIVVAHDVTNPSGKTAIVLADTGSGFVESIIDEGADIEVENVRVTPGAFYIMGSVRRESVHEPAIWRSYDGATWESVNPTINLTLEHFTTTSRGEWFVDEIVAPGGHFGVVNVRSSNLFVYSLDGVTWGEVPITDTRIFDTDVPDTTSLAVVGDSVVAVSNDPPSMFLVGSTAEQIIDPAVLPVPADRLTASSVATVAGTTYLAKVVEPRPADLGEQAAKRSELLTIGADGSVTVGDPATPYNIYSLIGVPGDGTVRALGSEWFDQATISTGDVDPLAWWAGPGGGLAEAAIEWPRDSATARVTSGGVAGNGTFVAVGHTFDSVDAQGNTTGLRTPLFWSSVDGLNWTAVDVPRDRWLDNFFPFGTCGLPSGGAISVGDWDPPGSTQPGVYVTPDGQSWEPTVRSSSELGYETAYFSDCTTTPTGVVVVGADQATGDAVAWFTADGRNFTVLDVPDVGARATFRDAWTTPDGRVFVVGTRRSLEWPNPTLGTLYEYGINGNFVGGPYDLSGDQFLVGNQRGVAQWVVGVGDQIGIIGTLNGGLGLWVSPLPPPGG